MTMNELRAKIQAGESPVLEVHAIEQIVYIAFTRAQEKLIPLKRRAGETLKFPSRARALTELAKAGVATVDFVHSSSYGEMIGTEGNYADTQMRQVIDLTRYADR